MTRPQRPPEPAWVRVLEPHLTSGELERLRRLTGNWRSNPFTYDEELRRFEISESWEQARRRALSDDELDLLLKACDVLSEHGDSLAAELGAARSAAPPGAQSLELHFDFSPTVQGTGDDARVAEQFVRLVRTEPAFRLFEEELGAVRRVTVRFEFRNDFEYLARKSRLDWFLELARRLVQRRPFEGRRL